MTKQVNCGGVLIGGGAPCSIQSMTTTDTRDIQATVQQIHRLEDAGCQIIRLAVPDREAAAALSAIKKQISIPVVADIHFDYRLALDAMAHGADKIRINPGNIGSPDRVRNVVQAAADRGIPIRVGVNAGSLDQDILERDGAPTAAGMVESVMRQVHFLEEMQFDDIVLSLKSSNVKLNTEAYRRISREVDYPLHIGVTEAGTRERGRIKSAVGLGALLLDGIGDTLRVSLTGDPVEEVLTARQILSAAGVRKEAVELISCPTCGRTQVNLVNIADQIDRALSGVTPSHSVTVAVMGCEVNGPGEARAADLGVACGKGKGILFRHGKILRAVPEEEIVSAVVNMVKEQ